MDVQYLPDGLGQKDELCQKGASCQMGVPVLAHTLSELYAYKASYAGMP